jgi:hypothetical protein
MPLTEMQCKCILKKCMDWGPAAGAAQPVVGGDASSEAQNHRTGPDWPPPAPWCPPSVPVRDMKAALRVAKRVASAESLAASGAPCGHSGRLPTLPRTYEQAKYNLGMRRVAGVDEAG